MLSERYNFTETVLDYIAEQDVTEQIDFYIQHKSRAKVYFLNAHCANVAVSNTAYQRALHQADLVLPDGVGVLWAAKTLELPHRQNLNGTDLIPRLARELIAKHGHLNIFILGGRPGVAEAAAEKLEAAHPGLRVSGTQHGYFKKEENASIIAEINRLEPDFVLVGMGVPLQELWIEQNAHLLNTGAVFAVGGLIDFLSGRIPRAPLPVRKAKMEWVWRFAMEPSRMFTRYVVGNPRFISHVLAARWSGSSKVGVQEKVAILD
jgi:exopolysaccharide biosynthesis WecB/TagA/CpsF family protein